MLNVIQEMNHYAHTWELFNQSRIGLEKTRMFMEISKIICPGIERTWKILFNEDWIPKSWNDVIDKLESMRTPNAIDLIRMRQVDIELIDYAIIQDIDKRLRFIMQMNGNEDNIREYAYTITDDGSIVD